MRMNTLLLKRHPPRRLATTPKSSAVMLALIVRVDAEPLLLLTRRQAGLRHYANDWCLPGGRLEPQDASLLACAWREFSEETGIPGAGGTLLGELDDFYNGKGELVRPFVCALPESVLQEHLRLQASEAVEYALPALSSLQGIVADADGQFPSARQPAYLLEIQEQGASKGHVWGLTASILLHVRDVLMGTVSPICKGEHFKREEANHGA